MRQRGAKTSDDLDADSPIFASLNEVYLKYRDDLSGNVATYIPELGKADPGLFGIALATADGQIYEAGDARHLFTIQSVSKPFVHGFALRSRHRLRPAQSWSRTDRRSFQLDRFR